MSVHRLALAIALVSVQYVQGFYLPGVAPKAFKDGERVSIKVQTVSTPGISLL
jgi:hypothetical protein